jgi:DUF1680 family protein
VPSWAAGATVRVRDEEATDAAPGAVSIRRAFRAGDAIVLDLPVAARVTSPDPRVDAVRGCVAIERGPEVLALESTDFGADIAEAVIDGDAGLVERDGRVVVRVSRRDTGAAAEVPLVPYHSWAQRGPSTMRIWLPTS